MNSTSGIIYYRDWDPNAVQVLPPVRIVNQPQTKATLATKTTDWSYIVGLGCLALSLGGLLGPLSPMLRLEGHYAARRAQTTAISWLQDFPKLTLFQNRQKQESSLAKPALAVFNPLVTENGSSIDPVDMQFGIVIPKIGVNSKVLASVNPTKPQEYSEALRKGIAHASTSFFPDENGTVYLFSHSTSFDWFVQDLNAVFYLLKNLEMKDKIVIFYKEKQYTYEITDKRVVSASAVSYLVPQKGAQKLILQTCWPPGSTTERLLIFADLIQPQSATK